MRNKVVFNMAELFCGPGGIALGAMRARIRKGSTTYSIAPCWANDIDAGACETYRRNIHLGESERVVCGPIQEIDLTTIPKFDGLSFGFPCNDFSRVGEQKGIKGKYGPLYTYGVQCLEIHSPKWFLAENVSGLTCANNGETFGQILNELENAGPFGYELTVHKYKFEQYGVPQQRHRIIIVGMRKDLGLQFLVPAPTTRAKENYISARCAIEVPPIDDGVPNHELTKQSKAVVERLKYIRPGENAWTASIPRTLQLNVKGAKLSQIYRRLVPDQPAYTLTGSGGGGTHAYHWKENRALTNRERARLQTFPDEFVFVGSKENVRKQIGMAVPPVAAKLIFEALLKVFAGVKYKSIAANYVFE
jgi:DNA (cytosine-5)-methyltransferase 1